MSKKLELGGDELNVILDMRISRVERRGNTCVEWRIGDVDKKASLENIICGYELFRELFPSMKDEDLKRILALPRNKEA